MSKGGWAPRLWRLVKGFIESQLVVDPEERWQAGMVSGVLWTLGTLIVLCMPVLPGGNSQHLLVRDVVSGCGFLWGLASLFLIDWRALAPVLINVTYLVGTAAIGFLVWATNVGTTAGPLFLCWMALFACYFYRPGAALFWVVLLLFVQALPLVYEPHAATRGAALITLLVAVVGDASIGVAVLTAKRRLVSLRARAEQEALTDPLTGAANHRVLDTQLRADLDRATGSGELLAAAVIDVDHLKQINDIGGHDRGDAALILVATSLRTLSRAGDTVARSGGDEFTWLLPGANASEARRRTEEARELIERSSGGNVTLSIGLADSSRTTEPAELMRLADGALYWSKAHGRNR
ncbi:MAG: diguanylate cyclase, partial [Solirubrobacterales bacterium]|nr:diguanylate cyclase [Solirubrobacterales bacterium]